MRSEIGRPGQGKCGGEIGLREEGDQESWDESCSVRRWKTCQGGKGGGKVGGGDGSVEEG